MIKVPISYVDFEGKDVTKDFYFNLTKNEIRKVDGAIPGGVEALLERIREDASVNDFDLLFEKIILAGYGKRLATGAFVKNKDYAEEFAASDAYSELLIKCYKNEDDFITKFLDGILNLSAADSKKVAEAQQAMFDEMTK